MARATLRTRVPLTDLWLGMVPTPGFIAHNPEVVSIQFADIHKRAVRLITWVPPLVGTGEVLIAIDEIVPLAYARFRLAIVNGPRDPDVEGDTELIIEDPGRHRILRLRHRVDGSPPRRILMGYLDDRFGRLLAARIDTIEARHSVAEATSTLMPMIEWLDCGDGDTRSPEPHAHGYRTAYGRARSDAETRALESLGRI